MLILYLISCTFFPFSSNILDVLEMFSIVEFILAKSHGSFLPLSSITNVPPDGILNLRLSFTISTIISPSKYTLVLISPGIVTISVPLMILTLTLLLMVKFTVLHPTLPHLSLAKTFSSYLPSSSSTLPIQVSLTFSRLKLSPFIVAVTLAIPDSSVALTLISLIVSL
ncbi:167aa long hypothetical protein [Pyrococcus horikoshii OT3]|uniref:Uncharacterized protein n=1 Tax=Pyrococcus horikoshii (strain ATCC 700860 / DSM 12428 / JCM 9974 / NBRC 100139 / OT-3) TaxID=70601 RepID=O58662_PYRHO|nr:167aa long hypothetical protein [Pyrococcus horikoshii OT3]